MKQLVLSSGTFVDVRNMLFTIILTTSIIFYSSASIFAQQNKIDCWTGVPGQSAPCSQQQATSCIQNPKFNTLYPVSPYQHFKDYPERDDGKPNPYITTPVPSETSPYSLDCSITSSGLGMVCLRTRSTSERRLSNIYVTDTREYVKAFWNVKYLEEFENMGTLLAKGTTMYPSLKRLDDGNLVPDQTEGDTYPVDKNEFDCIRPLSNSERTKMEQDIAIEYKAGQYNYYKKNGLLFVRLTKP